MLKYPSISLVKSIPFLVYNSKEASLVLVNETCKF